VIVVVGHGVGLRKRSQAGRKASGDEDLLTSTVHA
jgi:hypothetical protein